MSQELSCHRKRCAHRNPAISNPYAILGLVALRHPPPVFERRHSCSINRVFVTDRQGETNACSFSIAPRLNPDPSTMSLNNPLRDRETQSRSRMFASGNVPIPHRTKEL